MAQISFSKVKKEFFKEHPKGDVWKDDDGIHVRYNEDGKVYDYKYYNHIQFLNKVCNRKFGYEYRKQHYINARKKAKARLDKGYTINEWIGKKVKVDKQSTKKEIDVLNKKLDETIWL